MPHWRAALHFPVEISSWGWKRRDFSFCWCKSTTNSVLKYDREKRQEHNQINSFSFDLLPLTLLSVDKYFITVLILSSRLDKIRLFSLFRSHRQNHLLTITRTQKHCLKILKASVWIFKIFTFLKLNPYFGIHCLFSIISVSKLEWSLLQ